jgi:glycosyltransferase involved in cell wall biosynthesis
MEKLGMEPELDLVLLIPVYNDWDCVMHLLPGVDRAVGPIRGAHRVVLVDDGSTEPPPVGLSGLPLEHIARLDVLRLRRNLGHQRALAVGLCHVWEHVACDAVLVMDGDGEDNPADIPRLLDRYAVENGRAVVFAERMRRSERMLFRICYHAYRGIHWLLTGISVRVGNFSLLSRPLLGQLVVVPELWNHYAAAVFKARLPHVGVPTRRAPRLHGTSRMNFVALVVHGLSAISVFSDLVGVRALVASAGLLAMGVLGCLGAAVLDIGTGMLTAGDAIVYAMVLLLLVLATALAFMACIVTLGTRHAAPFIPLRDCGIFVDSVSPVVPEADDVSVPRA